MVGPAGTTAGVFEGCSGAWDPAGSTMDAGQPLPPDLGVLGGEELANLGRRDDRDVAPDRALERGHRGGGVDGLLWRAPLQRGPQEARGEGVARTDTVDRIHAEQ